MQAGNIFGGDWADAGAGFDSVRSSANYGQGMSRFVEKRDDYGKLFEDKLTPSKAVLTLNGKYIFTAAGSGLMVVNINRAMERIMYERFMEAMSRNAHVIHEHGKKQIDTRHR